MTFTEWLEWIMVRIEAMTQEQRLFISNCSVSARTVDHPYPDMTACEAALESNYGRSRLAVMGNNLFGMKQHQHITFGTIALPTREFQGGEWRIVEANFVKYPTLADCFEDRLATLRRLADVYPNYKEALEAQSPEDYVRAVSKTWSTDPTRADKVILIYRQYVADFEQPA